VNGKQKTTEKGKGLPLEIPPRLSLSTNQRAGISVGVGRALLLHTQFAEKMAPFELFYKGAFL